MRRIALSMLALVCFSLTMGGAVSAWHRAVSHQNGVESVACGSGSAETPCGPVETGDPHSEQAPKDADPDHDCPICVQIAAGMHFDLPTPALTPLAAVVRLAHAQPGAVVHPTLHEAPATPRGPPATA